MKIDLEIGDINMLITLLFFIIGSTLGTAHLQWWMTLPNAGPVSLILTRGWISALIIQLIILGTLYWIVRKIDVKTNKQIYPLWCTSFNSKILRALACGPWPIWWGVAVILMMSTLTLVVAGHPWSITFAFGLWGAKIWNAIGGDPATWPYWSNGYPSQALHRSVLADTTSIMDFGIVLGATLAAALGGKFAPPGRLTFFRTCSALAGGLLLGYGARLGFGCNIGALFSGISTGSIHGWLWLSAAFLGNIAGVQFRKILDLLNN